MPYPHQIVEDRPESVVIRLTAWDTKKVYQLELPADGYYRWMDGAVIQKALPQLSVDERELLISGTDPSDPTGIFDEPEE